jgi:phenylacetate-CoA ligase
VLNRQDLEARCKLIARAPRQSRAALLENQAELLRHVLLHAGTHVPFYRDLYRRHGAEVSRIKTVQDLQRLPMVTRRTLQAAPAEELLAQGVTPQGLKRHASSGSTGMPLTTRRTAIEQELYDWITRRTNALASPSFRGQVVYVGLISSGAEENAHAEIAEPTRGSSAFSGLRAGPPLSMVECRRPVQDIIQAVIASSPDVLMGYPGALEDVARFASPAQLARIRPKFVACCGEVLTDLTRQFLAERFRAPVTSMYGATECSWFGTECAHTGEFHLIDDSVILEVVDERGAPVAPGEQGHVVVTALHSFAQPYLRYSIGDLAVQGKRPVGSTEGCACGSPWSTLGEVSGRVVEYLSLPDGTRVHGYTLAIPLRDKADFLSQYQIVQLRRDLIRVRMRYQVEPRAAELALLRSQLAAYVPGVTLEFEEVAHIEREPNGKYRTVVALP